MFGDLGGLAMKMVLCGFVVMALLAAGACAAGTATPDVGRSMATATATGAGAAATPTTVMPTATAAATARATLAAGGVATGAAGASGATATPEAGETSGSIMLILPTATALPTATPRPTATPYPTARAVRTAGDDDICRRTPAVQWLIMDRLNVRLCTAISPRELFRIEGIKGNDWEFAGIGHPDDLAGFDNLRYMGVSGRLDYVDFSHTPRLEVLWVRATEWPPGWSFDNLPNLKSLDVRAEGAAACDLFQEGTLERLMAPLAGRLDGIDWGISIKIPPTITEDADLAARSLAAAVGLTSADVWAMLDNGKGRNMFGDAWDQYSAAEKREALGNTGYRGNLFALVFGVDIQTYHDCGE